jgi:hypothetical protein
MERYFLYSQEQFNEKNEILKNSNKEFVCGTVVVNGSKKQFTNLSNSSSLPRFIDAKVIAKGDPSKMVYTMPKTVKKDTL